MTAARRTADQLQQSPSMPRKSKSPIPGAAPQKAVIRDSVFYTNDNCAARAPLGEYDLTREGECAIGFCNCATRDRFTLSLDAVARHLFEGSIRLAPGARLPV